MEQVYLVFCNSKLPLSPIIRAVTRGRWSHVALICDAASVLEATGAHGVTKTPLDTLIKRSTEHCIVEVDVPRGTFRPKNLTKLGFFGKCKIFVRGQDPLPIAS